MTKLIVNCESGEVLGRELNETEVNQQASDEAEITLLQAAAAEKAFAKAAVLAQMGITKEQAQLLLG